MTNKELPNQEPATKDKPACRDYRLTEEEALEELKELVNALDKSLAHPNIQENPVSSIVGQAREYKDTKQEVCIPKGETKIQNLERGMERLEQLTKEK